MKKILIFRQSSLGDFIVGIPALKIIRKKFINHKIYHLSYRHTIAGAVNPDSILNNNKTIDEFIYKDYNKALENAIAFETICMFYFYTKIITKKKFISKNYHKFHYLRKNGENKFYGQ